MEYFKDIKNYEGIYQVSNLGRVKSLERKKWNGYNYHIVKEKILKNNKGNHGYLRVGLFKDGKQEKKMIHFLVAQAFMNYKKTGLKYVLDHIDNCKTNNNLNNLQIISFRHNISKDVKNKTSKYTGVSWNKIRNKWVAQIMINGKLVFLGYHNTEIQAKEAYLNRLKAL